MQRCGPILALVASLLLSGCDALPDWLSGAPAPVKRTAGERIDVVRNTQGLTPDTNAKDIAVEVPEQSNLEQWLTANQAMGTGHIGLTGVTRSQSARVGAGYGFGRTVVSQPVVASGMVFAMDAAGHVSAHDASDIETVRWVDRSARQRGADDVLGGGLAYDNGTLYATSGLGSVRALDATNGQVKWSVRLGAPVRGAPAVAEGLVVVLTADNQTFAYDAATGQPRWEHRGIRETAGYFSTTRPTISDGVVVVAYSSGEVFALRLESGAALWSDTLSGGARTRASGIFSGIDADPVITDGVVVVASSSGEMQASILASGRPLWQNAVGTHATPWSAGNVLFTISSSNDLAAILKRDGSVRWSTPLLPHQDSRSGQDDAAPLYGPILSANAVLVIDGKGVLTSFKPSDGERIGSFELANHIVTHPVIANGAMYLLSKDGTLWKYY